MAAGFLKGLFLSAEEKIELEIVRHVALLRDRDSSKREQAAWALIHLTIRADNKLPIGRTAGAIEGLILLLRDGNPGIRIGAARAVESLAADAVPIGPTLRNKR